MVIYTYKKICRISHDIVVNKGMKETGENPRWQWLLKESQVKKKGRHQGKCVA